jgi:hypothetical protein
MSFKTTNASQLHVTLTTLQADEQQTTFTNDPPPLSCLHSWQEC